MVRLWLSNRFGDGPYAECQQFIQVVLPQGVEIEGTYNAARSMLSQTARLLLVEPSEALAGDEQCGYLEYIKASHGSDCRVPIQAVCGGCLE